MQPNPVQAQVGRTGIKVCDKAKSSSYRPGIWQFVNNTAPNIKFPNISLTEFPVTRPGTHVESLKFGNATRIISIFSMIADTVSVLVQGSSTSTPQSDRSICYATRANRNLEVCWHRVSRQSQETWIKYMGSFRWLQQSAYPCERRAVWCKLEKYKFTKKLKKTWNSEVGGCDKEAKEGFRPSPSQPPLRNRTGNALSCTKRYFFR